MEGAQPCGSFYAYLVDGFAEYFGAPRGGRLTGPDQLTEPGLLTLLGLDRVPDERTAPQRYSPYWPLGVAAVACLMLVLILKFFLSYRKSKQTS